MDAATGSIAAGTARVVEVDRRMRITSIGGYELETDAQTYRMA
jgi:hypothetical protein